MEALAIGVVAGLIAIALAAILGFVFRPIRQLPTRVKQWWTERKARAAHVAATKLSLQDSVLHRGCLVIVRFKSRPSNDWLDPRAEVQGLWDERRLVPLLSPLRYEDRDGTPRPVLPAWVPLCIPSLGVETEWREATHVKTDPLWRGLKHHVVDAFLHSAVGKTFVCSVLPGRKPGGFLLNCAAYDRHLHDEWPRFKALEAAFAVNVLYRHQDLQDLADPELRDFVVLNLPTLLDKPTIQRVPKQYRQPLLDRPLDADAAYLVLRGLVERYRRSGMRALRT